MTPVLMDASCVLAWLHDEPGWREVDDHITSAYITSVNMVEVITRVEREGRDGMLVATGLVQSGLTVVPVGWPEVSASARVRQASGVSSRRELSLGDVVCLSYGWAQGMDVWTADRAWAKLGLPVRVSVIR